MTLEDSKLEILRGVEQGTLSIEEGAHLLEILEAGAAQKQAVPVQSTSQETATPHAAAAGNNLISAKATSAEPESVPAGWRAAWGIFLWLGVAFMGLSGFWLYSSYARSGLGVGFWFALFFMLVSCLIVYLGWQIIDSRWVAVRIRSHAEKGDKDISVWAPLPLKFARWIFRTFGTYMPEKVQARHIEEIIDEMEEAMEPNEPFVIDIDGEKGSRTHIDFGGESGNHADISIEL